MNKLILFLSCIFILTNCYNKKYTIQTKPRQPVIFKFSVDTLSGNSIKIKKKLPFISVAAVGDIMIGNHTIGYIKNYGVDYPFKNAHSILNSANITIANMETPLTTSGTKFVKRFTFKMNPKYVIGLINAGLDDVKLANNHILDYGVEGLQNTISFLDSIGLVNCGVCNNM